MTPPSLNFYRESTNLPVARASFSKPAPFPKAPIVNPYEKLTQPQFDAWIGDITSALRDALDYRAEVRPKPKVRTEWQYPGGDERDEATASDDAEEQSYLDDTFAEAVGRRAQSGNAKGKGRDPREGPGLGRGDRSAPIEIDMDSDEGEEEENAESDRDERYEQEEEEEGEEEEEEDEEVRTSEEEQEEEEYALRNGESSAHAHARYRKYADRREDDAEEEEYEDDDEEAAPDAIEIISDDDEVDTERPAANKTVLQEDLGSGEDYSDGEDDADPTSFSAAQNIDYDDEAEETGSESEEEDGQDRGSLPPLQYSVSHPPRQYSRDGRRKVLRDEQDELQDDADSQEDEESEIFEVDSDDEHAAHVGEPGEEEDAHARPQLSTLPDELDNDDLPGSSPILSSPIEPELIPGNSTFEVLDVDELEEDNGNPSSRMLSSNCPLLC